MAHFHVKKKKGRPYLYVREIARVNGRPKVVSQVYIGSPERTAKLVQKKKKEPVKLKVQEFGALWAANLLDSDVRLDQIVDSLIPPNPRETGPTVGEYFLYAVLNRMVDAKSKRSLPGWYQDTAIQFIRPVDVKSLSSERYWAKWDRVTPNLVDEIGKQFFKRIWELESPGADCILFDTTNYYTFMATHTESELSERGKNKAGRHHLRQIGLGLLVDRNSRLPLYYSVYPGNRHDSKEFGRIIDEMFGIITGLNQTKERITVVIDKGMNSEDNISWIDAHSRVHFITTYSPCFAQDLSRVPLSRFEPVDTRKNRQLAKAGKAWDQMRVFRTSGEYWGKKRTVVVTHYPPTARKQEYTFHCKLEKVRQELITMRKKVRDQVPHWKKPEAIKERFRRLCGRLHIGTEYYDLSFVRSGGRLKMGFRKNIYQIRQKEQSFGRNIIITDNTDWLTRDIVEANQDRWKVENQFRQSKDSDLVSARPIRHWTDSKIHCHLLTCVVALTYLRRLELRLERCGIRRTAKDVMEDLNKLHSVLLWDEDSKHPRRVVEQPSKTQSEVLKALGYKIDPSGVVQKLDS